MPALSRSACRRPVLAILVVLLAAVPALAWAAGPATDQDGVDRRVALEAALGPLAIDGETVTGTRSLALADLFGEPATIEAPFTLNGVEARPLASGQERLTGLLSDIEAGGPAALLSLHDSSGRLVDRVSVGFDRFNHFDSETPVLHAGPGTDLFVLRSTHGNSSQAYDLMVLVDVAGGKLRQVDSVFTLSDRNCGYERNQTSRVEPAAHKDASHGAFNLIVTEEVVHTDEECESVSRPEAGRKTASQRYDWDAAAGRFVADPAGIEAVNAVIGDNENRL